MVQRNETNKGSILPTLSKPQTEESSGVTKEDVDTSVNESGAEEVSVDTAVEGEVTEPEMGRDCREKVPSVKLRDYVSYNARYLKEKSPPHDLDHTPAPTL